MTYRDEQNRIWEDIEFKEKALARLEKREKLAQAIRARGFVLDDTLVNEARKLAKRPAETDDEFIERLFRAIADGLGVPADQ